ncbi:MAG: biotin/lipoate A/B protein ligase family protein [Candidatus Kaelpia imicola]|nr:biotin/lipoate A/B protein ligase family protein [Candidatus Kaelpia imicola]
MAKSLRRFRLILSGCSHPYCNMAFDQALISSVSNLDSPPIFRVYGWRPYGVSFGFTQKIETVLDLERCDAKNVPYVRRMTGGSVILHRDDISYSVISKREDLCIRGGVLDSYKTINSFLIRFYESLGLKVEYAENKDSGIDSGVCSFFKERYDVIYKGLKIGGNAQRRRGDVLFQHGSISLKDSSSELLMLLKESSRRSEAKSISLNRALNREIGFREAEALLAGAFKDTFEVEFKESSLLDEELLKIEFLDKNKYSTKDWNLERRDYAKETSSLVK